METWGRAACNPMKRQCTYVSTDTICNSKSQKTGNLISVATLVVNGNLGAGCLQPNEYAMYLCMSSTDLYCALYICFGRGSKKNKRKKKVATRYHVALCCSSNSTAWTSKSIIIWLLFSHFLSQHKFKFLSKLYIPSTYSKHWPYIVAHTIDCVCSKILNHYFLINNAH